MLQAFPYQIYHCNGRDSKIYYLPYSTAEEFFTTNAETMQIKCTLVEQSYLLMYHRLLDMYCKTTEELYLDLLNRCPDIQEHITLKEVASFLQVTPETIIQKKWEWFFGAGVFFTF